ncbi:hypothetical protein Moror_1069 [Moniliophthora roreri MCA 2997]|uniref:Heterokaryon incompatibility domain-containing protein n=2 Tax=Moniliophthora roreri TaxID=221103 RepID=V2YQ18_MONRO|nr:hypothetical protein Moror_1069 [Moniliophthora roreri MCA 2997]KAI3596715.1 hypothetical protein WG66_016453 [Moniliophthora roreri]
MLDKLVTSWIQWLLGLLRIHSRVIAQTKRIMDGESPTAISTRESPTEHDTTATEGKNIVASTDPAMRSVAAQGDSVPNCETGPHEHRAGATSIHRVEAPMAPRATVNDTVPGVQFLQTGKHGGNFPLAIYEPAGERISENFASTKDRIPPITGKSIFSASLANLRAAAEHDERIDLTPLATPERYRFIDCAEVVRGDTLQVWETQELPYQYAAISHVWKSLPPEEDPKLTARGVILVECEDRNDGGPISVDVLRYTCLASLQAGVQLLWLDRLCIVQTPTVEGKKDKRWQIMRMYDIYKGCSICFVLPGGLRRFPTKSEETEWIERAWTFQEVMVAPVVKVLYTEYVGSPPEIFVHNMHIEEYFKMQEQLYGDDRDGSQERRYQFVQALDKRQQYREPTLEHLGRFRDVWEHVQWRRSARPVDVVFSVMGILGVTLDPAQFGKEDRLRATIAMAQALLLKDHSRNTCIDIPLWRRMSRSKLDTARETGVNPKEYMADIPTRVRLQDLEQELDTQPLRRFAFASRMNLESGLQADQREEAEDEDLEGLKDVKAVVMGSGQADHAVRSFLGRKIDSSLKSRKKAERIRSQIPPHLLHEAYDTPSQGGERIFVRRPHNPVIELCRELVPSSASEREVTNDPCSSTEPLEQYVFGWSIQSTLWVRLGRYTNPRQNEDTFNPDKVRSAPVPIITVFKFSLDF